MLPNNIVFSFFFFSVSNSQHTIWGEGKEEGKSKYISIKQASMFECWKIWEVLHTLFFFIVLFLWMWGG
jgi:hypothetical protein